MNFTHLILKSLKSVTECLQLQRILKMKLTRADTFHGLDPVLGALRLRFLLKNRKRHGYYDYSPFTDEESGTEIGHSQNPGSAVPVAVRLSIVLDCCFTEYAFWWWATKQTGNSDRHREQYSCIWICKAHQKVSRYWEYAKGWERQGDPSPPSSYLGHVSLNLLIHVAANWSGDPAFHSFMPDIA